MTDPVATAPGTDLVQARRAESKKLSTTSTAPMGLPAFDYLLLAPAVRTSATCRSSFARRCPRFAASGATSDFQTDKCPWPDRGCRAVRNLSSGGAPHDTWSGYGPKPAVRWRFHACLPGT